MIKKYTLPLAWLLAVAQLGSAIAFAVILVHAKYSSYRFSETDGQYSFLFDQAEWWKAILSLSPMLLSALLCIGLAVATLITLYIRKRKPAVSLPIMTGLAAVGHAVLFVPYSLANLQDGCDALVSNVITFFRPDTRPTATIDCENAVFLTLCFLFAAGTVISLILFILTLRPLIRIKKDNPPSCG